MAPEAIIKPEEVSARSDLYALGAVGFFLLTGTHLFTGTSILEICGQQMHETPQRPSERLGQPLPTALEDLLLQCLAKSPADRPANAAEFRDLLEKCALPSWDQATAQSWWRDNAPQLASVPDATSSTSKTIMVDLARLA
jgi:serine/threonine-protein kinase